MSAMPLEKPAVQAVEATHPRGGMREVVILAYPVILNQISITALGVVDTAMVGRLGATELAAVGLGSLWTWTVVNLFMGMASAVQTFVSQADGAGDTTAPGRWTWQAMYALFPLACLVAAIVHMGAPSLLAALGPSAAMQTIAVDYMQPRLWGAGAVTGTMVLASFFRGLGDTRTPLYATLVANVINAVLDYGLIFGRLGLPEWGAAGAGAATAIAEWIGFVYLMLAFGVGRTRLTYPTRPVRLATDLVRRLIRMGLPIGGQWVMGMIGFSLFSTLIARMGDEQMAASQAFIVLLSLSFMQAIGISAAASTLVGRYIGAGDLEASRRSFRSAEKLAVGLGAGIALIFIAAPEALLSVFSSNERVLSMGVPLVLLGASFQFIDALGIVASGALRGAGDTRWPFMVQAVLEWGFYLPLAYFLGITLEGGLFGAWLGCTIYVALLSGLLIWRFRTGAWEKIII